LIAELDDAEEDSSESSAETELMIPSSACAL
jgi:hypothetical protein